MPLVATLIADPSNPALTARRAEQAASAVSGGSPDWLADSIACDIVLPDGLEPEAADSALRAALNGAPVDIVVQPSRSRRKKLLIADMDSTMIRQECIDELADEAGFGERVAAITALAMNGEIEFESAMRERVSVLKGLPVDIIDKVLAERIELTPGGRELIATMKKSGAHTALVSGGFTHFTGPVAAMLGFDENRANVLLAQDGVLTGTVAEPVLGQQAKVDCLHHLIDRHDLAMHETLAVGDGANDLGMLSLAGSGVALHAKPVVAAQSKMRIDHGDLTALLYIQGYRKSEFEVPL